MSLDVEAAPPRSIRGDSQRARPYADSGAAQGRVQEALLPGWVTLVQNTERPRNRCPEAVSTALLVQPLRNDARLAGTLTRGGRRGHRARRRKGPTVEPRRSRRRSRIPGTAIARYRPAERRSPGWCHSRGNCPMAAQADAVRALSAFHTTAAFMASLRTTEAHAPSLSPWRPYTRRTVHLR